MSNFDIVFTLLGKPEGQQELINTIIDITTKRLCNLLGADTVPDRLSFIVPEVSVVRFNRIGSEGTASHTVGSEAMSFSDDDFAGYEKDMNAWKAQNSALGTVFFL